MQLKQLCMKITWNLSPCRARQWSLRPTGFSAFSHSSPSRFVLLTVPTDEQILLIQYQHQTHNDASSFWANRR